MFKLASVVIYLVASTLLTAQIPPSTEGTLSTTRLLSVERLKSGTSEQGPDGLAFCFLVSRTPVARHKLAIKETRDFMVSQQSNRKLSQSALGRVYEPKMAVYDAAKYAADHVQVASAVSAAPERSLIVTLDISGPTLKDGDDLELILHVGFGRSPEKPEAENLVFATTVPARRLNQASEPATTSVPTPAAPEIARVAAVAHR